MVQLSSAGDEATTQQLVLHNEPAEAVRLSQWLHQTVASAFRLSDKLTFRLDLILQEALTNVIDYAFAADAAAQQIIVWLHADAHTVTAQVIDEGRPFNPLQEHEVKLPTSLEEAGQGGLGLHLIRSYSQTCHYQRTDGKNIFTMILEKTD